MPPEIAVCPMDAIAPLLAQARRDGINTAEVKSSCIWFSARSEVGVIGFAKIMRLSPTRARLCNAFVIPTERGKGVGAALIDSRIAYCKAHCYRVIDCYAYNPKRYLALGFEIVKKYRSSYGDTYHMEVNYG